MASPTAPPAPLAVLPTVSVAPFAVSPTVLPTPPTAHMSVFVVGRCIYMKGGKGPTSITGCVGYAACCLSYVLKYV